MVIHLTENNILNTEDYFAIPASYAQKRLWFIDQLDPGKSTYNITLAYSLSSNLDFSSLEKALNKIRERHEILRTTFINQEGEPYQLISPYKYTKLQVLDLKDKPNEEAFKRVNFEAQLPFNLEEGPLMRPLLIQLADGKYILAIVFHHIVFDGWSKNIFLQELSNIYNSYIKKEEPLLKELNIQYADYTLWQKDWLDGENLSRQLSYWKEKLSGELPILDLPIDYSRPPTQTFSGGKEQIIIPKTISDLLINISNDEEVTLFMTLLAAYKLFMHKLTGQEDILIGSPIANRDQNDIGKLIGFFINTLAFRSKIDKVLTFRNFLREVRHTSLDAFQHANLPFEKLVEELQPNRDTSVPPIFQTMFVFQDERDSSFTLDNVDISQISHENNISKFDLTLFADYNNANQLVLTLEYNTDLFKRKTIKRILENFHTLLNNIVTNPYQSIAELQAISTKEKENLLLNWNNNIIAYDNKQCFHELFEKQVEKSPNSIAIRYEQDSITYAELNDKANQIAHYLLKNGVYDEAPIVVYMNRSPEIITTLLGISKAGACYVPLDPEQPLNRIEMIINDINPAFIISESALKNNFTKFNQNTIMVLDEISELYNEKTNNVNKTVSIQQLAYIIHTSGSTGRPKGVAIEHSQLFNYITSVSGRIGNSYGDAFAIVQSFSVDFGHTMVFPPLISGGTLHIISKERIYDPQLLLEYFQNNKIDYLKITPSHYSAMINSRTKGKLLPGKCIIFGGETISWKLLEDSGLLDSSCKIFNHYGPSEATVGVLMYEVNKKDDINSKSSLNVPIGKSLPNIRTFILDSDLKPVPIGSKGELYIGGSSLARGYYKNEIETNRCFLLNASKEIMSERIYKTGDIVRYLDDGNIEYLGRNDNQVKIRGHRVELNEVNTVLRKHPLINDAVVISKGKFETRLIAFVVTKGIIDLENLLEFYRVYLPDYMIPAEFVEIRKLPLLPNGKVDYKSLLTLYQEDSDQQISVQNEMNSQLELDILSIMSSSLGKKNINTKDNFFEIGGHSLLAIKLAYNLSEHFKIEVPVKLIFEQPTVKRLANKISDLINTSTSKEMTEIKRINRADNLPLSFGQQRIWFMDKLEPNSALYNEFLALNINGNLNIKMLEKSLNTIIQRHEILRTTFKDENGEPSQVIQNSTELKISIKDLSSIQSKDRDSVIMEIINEQINIPFDLSTGPLIRCNIIQKNNHSYVFLLVMHHIIFDGWSIEILQNEMSSLYNSYLGGIDSKLKSLKIQFADYANWQKDGLYKERFKKQLEYWEDKLGGELPVLSLPTDFPRPKVQSYQGSKKTVTLPVSIVEKLKQISLKEDATLYMTMLSAYNIFLHRYTQQEDILIGTPIANRNRKELENLIGFFVNTLVIRTNISEDISFRDLIKSIRQNSIDAFANQDLPFEKLVESIQPNRDMSYSPVFQTMFVYNTESENIDFKGLEVSSFDVQSNVSKFDLTLYVNSSVENIDLTFEYNKDLFKDTTINRMMDHFLILLDQISILPEENISKLSLLSKEEFRKQVYEWNDTQINFPNKCLHKLIEESVLMYPDEIAAVYQESEITYKELNEHANQLAYYLREQGVGPDVPVGICLDRSIDLVISLLAILKAGGAYVPLNVEGPQKRNDLILEDSKALICLTNKEIMKDSTSNSKLVDLQDIRNELVSKKRTNPDFNQLTNSLISIYYTSGSTGNPKGVANMHQGWVNRMHWMQRKYNLMPGETVLQKTTLTFDDSAVEFFWTLMYGGRIALMDPGHHKDPKMIIDAAIKYKVSLIQFVPSMLSLFLDQITEDEQKALKTLREVISSGEALKTSLAKKFFSKLDANLNNQWGVTEVSIDSTFNTLEKNQLSNEGLTSIGRPIDNNFVYILDKYLNPIPIGVRGEIYIAGVGLARKYINNIKKTKESFVKNPFSHSEIMYKTGDIGIFKEDGTIVYLGREDDQIKINGQRVEIGEIESNITNHNKIKNCVVVPIKRKNKYILCAYFSTSSEENSLTVKEIRNYLKDKLPDYMIPSEYLKMDDLPLNTSGKVDRKALPPIELNREKENYVAPRSTIERRLCSIWESILEIEKVGIKESFFELGGHSLDAVRVNTRMNRECNSNHSLLKFFENPTIESFLSSVTLKNNEYNQQLNIEKIMEEDKPYRLSHAQLRHWFQHAFDPQNALGFKYTAEINGDLDVKAFELAIEIIQKRHAIMRTLIIEENGIPYQIVKKSIAKPFEYHDLSMLSEFDKKLRLKSLVTHELLTPFKLHDGGLIKFTLYKLEKEKFILMRRIHHIAWDGWSHTVLMKELNYYYQLLKGDIGYSDENRLPYQYIDYSEWHNNSLDGFALDNQREYWESKLSNFKTPPIIPKDSDCYAKEMIPQVLTINSELTSRLEKMSSQNSTTSYMTMLAVLKIWISKISGVTDITIGSPFSGRTQPELEEVIGVLNNPVVLLTDLSGNPTFIEVLERIKITTLNAQENQDYPFDLLLKNRGSKNALYNIMFIWNNASESYPELDGFKLKNYSLNEIIGAEEILTQFPKDPSVSYDLYFQVSANEKIEITTYYNPLSFKESTVQRFLEEIKNILEQVLEQDHLRLDQIELNEEIDLDCIF